MNEYLKLYETMDAAVSDTTVVAPNVTLCKENMQVLMGSRELDIDEPMEIVYDGADRLKYFYTRYLLKFTCVEDGNISLSNFGDNEPNIEYKLNDADWTEWDYIGIPMASGDTIMFKGNNENGFSLSGNVYSKFVITIGKFNASGSIMSLIDGIGETLTIPSGSTFKNLFNGNSGLLTPPELPATGITSECYNSMFSSCTNLTTAPVLPAMTLENSCYSYMFGGCASLVSAPELPATNLNESCYYGMFNGCIAITETPELPALVLKYQCYSHMFSGCTGLIEAKEMSFTSFDISIYHLSSGSNCCRHMFDSCTSLTTVQNELRPLVLQKNCYAYMYRNCISLTTAPTLPALTLNDSCYYGMFYNCNNLSYIKCLATTISGIRISSPTSSWVEGIDGLGNFVVPNNTQNAWDNKSSGSGKPTNFTYVDA